MQTAVPKGQVNYEPSSLGADIARESADHGYRTFAAPEAGDQLRIRPDSFADHYSQARLFFASQTPPEQNHIVSALIFELSKCVTPRVREAICGETRQYRPDSGRPGRGGPWDHRRNHRRGDRRSRDRSAPPSPALESILAKAKPTLQGRKIGCLVSDGVDDALLAELKAAAQGAGAKVELIAPTIGGVTTAGGARLPSDHRIDGGPSVLFDAIALLPSAEGGAKLALESAAVNFVRDLPSAIGRSSATSQPRPLFVKGGLSDANPDTDAGLIPAWRCERRGLYQPLAAARARSGRASRTFRSCTGSRRS